MSETSQTTPCPDSGVITTLDAVSVQGGDVNEDRFGVDQRIAWVVDGATGLGDRRFLAGDSDAQTFAAAASAIIPRIASDPGRSLQAVLIRLIDELRARFEPTLTAASAQPHEVPSAALAILRLCGPRLEYAVLGDCRIVIETGGGYRTAGSNSALEALDQKVGQRIRQLHDLGVTDGVELRRRLMPLLREHRSRMNTEHGYWSLSLNPRAAQGAEYGTLHWTHGQRAVLMSDGFYRVIEPFGRYGVADFFLDAARGNLSAMAVQLRAMERADRQCLHFPRIKCADDATALCVALHERY